MKEIKVPYKHDGMAFEGAIVWDDSVTAKRPVLFMQPDWSGVSKVMIDAAKAICGQDYIVLVADMYGAGYAEKPKDFGQLMASMQAVHNDLPFTLGCGKAAFEALLTEAQSQGLVDDGAYKLAVGYCAGGGFVLEQARAGLDFDAITVLHVTNPDPVVPGTPCNIKGRVLAIHGASDPVTPKEKIHAFEAELTEAGVDWQVVMLGEGRHAFCVPKESIHEAIRFDEKLCRRSYMIMHDFFAETCSGD